MEKNIYLIRHGQSEENVDHVARGDRALLTEGGRAQAMTVAERVARLEVTSLISSPFVRTFETASVISARIGLPVEQSELFREWNGPSVYLGKHEDHPERAAARVAIMNKTDRDFRHSDEETFAELHERANQALVFLEAREEDRICVVTHFGFLQMIAAVVLFGDRVEPWMTSSMFYRLRHRNTGITNIKLSLDKEGKPFWQLITWNDQTHLG